LNGKLAGATCVKDVAATLKPSPAVIDYCRERVAKDADCDFEQTMAECVGGHELYTDEVIHDLEDCLSHSCRHYHLCFGAVVGRDEGVAPARRRR
jgi:hypothetical protein